MSASNENHRGDAAFTVVELLVVIALLALLATLLQPTLRHAREKAGTAVCRTNLHRRYLAFAAYSESHLGKAVPYIAPTEPTCDGNKSVIWQMLLVRRGYLPMNPLSRAPYESLRLDLKCPSNHNGYYANPGGGPDWYDGTPNYLYNSQVGIAEGCPGSLAYPLKKMAAIPAPAVSEGGFQQEDREDREGGVPRDRCSGGPQRRG